MKIDIVSVFPEYFEVMYLSLMGKAQAKGLLEIKAHNLRDWTHDVHHSVDDTPVGGGAGMVMKPEVWSECLDELLGFSQPSGSPAPSGAPVLIYRFPNLYGKWCRPRYNSAVATFCDAIANGRPYTVNDPSVELELLYIDDLVDEMLGALLGEEHRCGYEGLERVEGDGFCYVPETDVQTLGEIVYLLDGFRDSRETLAVPDLSDGSFSKKLWSTLNDRTY